MVVPTALEALRGGAGGQREWFSIPGTAQPPPEGGEGKCGHVQAVKRARVAEPCHTGTTGHLAPSIAAPRWQSGLKHAAMTRLIGKRTDDWPVNAH